MAYETKITVTAPAAVKVLCLGAKDAPPICDQCGEYYSFVDVTDPETKKLQRYCFDCCDEKRVTDFWRNGYAVRFYLCFITAKQAQKKIIKQYNREELHLEEVIDHFRYQYSKIHTIMAMVDSFDLSREQEEKLKEKRFVKDMTDKIDGLIRDGIIKKHKDVVFETADEADEGRLCITMRHKKNGNALFQTALTYNRGKAIEDRHEEQTRKAGAALMKRLKMEGSMIDLSDRQIKQINIDQMRAQLDRYIDGWVKQGIIGKRTDVRISFDDRYEQEGKIYAVLSDRRKDVKLARHAILNDRKKMARIRKKAKTAALLKGA